MSQSDASESIIMIYSTCFRRQNTNLSGNRLEELKARLLKHLKEEHLNYFICWTNLLKMENSLNYGKSSKDIYTVSPSERYIISYLALFFFLIYFFPGRRKGSAFLT